MPAVLSVRLRTLSRFWFSKSRRVHLARSSQRCEALAPEPPLPHDEDEPAFVVGGFDQLGDLLDLGRIELLDLAADDGQVFGNAEFCTEHQYFTWNEGDPGCRVLSVEIILEVDSGSKGEGRGVWIAGTSRAVCAYSEFARTSGTASWGRLQGLEGKLRNGRDRSLFSNH